MTTTNDYIQDRRKLVALLRQKGTLQDRLWCQAFLDVPRHVFVPKFTLLDAAENLVTIDRRQPEEWLAAVYSDDALVTSHDESGIACSSSTQPFVMAVMLEVLQARSGMRVLEIGTGTGYNTALLSYALGAQNVTSVEIDSAVSRAAKTALVSLDFRPEIIVGDGLQGFPANAPYDRIIATCSTRKVPQSWLEQTADNGVIVVNLGFGIIALSMTTERVASGQFHPEVAAFIEARPADGRAGLPFGELIRIVNQEPETVSQGDNPSLITTADFEFLLKLVIPGLSWYTRLDDLGNPERWGATDIDSGSWITLDHHGDMTTVSQGGARKLWPTIQTLYQSWLEAGKPSHDHYGLTIAPDGQHSLWLTNPDNVIYVLD
ncbi:MULTISPECIES: methyltransferase domain-containing protein [unclassified Crossiella]|uniref:methyltransferase domain-containing protein n=1 Tax=unclassified Crossiella TaxID=2620835 RepID=UPI001FFFDB4B|nr:MULTISPECIES: methyltransferase domain-containing protein [unclassified Crossiella]MCK2241227.1 protein-L-isoaspartate carboxylmethyltransferase [Crossiella sp. S99.2]MCK2253629.1 protein-L-isoaspartate carboxylmethyltransferase [Crossiella sp. S99.1]